MSLGLVGRKVGMTRIFTADGDAVPVTVLDVSNNRITQIKTPDTDGYSAVQVYVPEQELGTGAVQLKVIEASIRRVRVLAIELDALVLEQGGRLAMPPGLVYVHCSASAVRQLRVQPIFQPGLITPQLVRAPLVTFSAAVCAA